MNIFQTVKAGVTVREAAARYGVAVGRSGMACCIFHADRHPSMKVDERYHCFACGADGDVIAFTAQLFGLTPMQAAEKLAQDFGLAVPPHQSRGKGGAPEQAQHRPYDKTAYVEHLYGEYCRQLEKLRTKCAPKSPDEPLSAAYCEAVHCLDYAAELVKWLHRQTPEARRDWLLMHKKEVEAIERRVRSRRMRA